MIRVRMGHGSDVFMALTRPLRFPVQSLITTCSIYITPHAVYIGIACHKMGQSDTNRISLKLKPAAAGYGQAWSTPKDAEVISEENHASARLSVLCAWIKEASGIARLDSRRFAAESGRRVPRPPHVDGRSFIENSGRPIGRHFGVRTGVNTTRTGGAALGARIATGGGETKRVTWLAADGVGSSSIASSASQCKRWHGGLFIQDAMTPGPANWATNNKTSRGSLRRGALDAEVVHRKKSDPRTCFTGVSTPNP